MHVKALQEKLPERQVVLHVEKAVVEKIADLGYVPEFGARPLKRVIQ